MAENETGSSHSAFVDKYVSGVKKATWLICRERRHLFPDHPNKIKTVGEDSQFVDRIYKCRRCGVKLIESLHVVDGAARRIGVKREDYPEGYLMEKGSGRLTAEDRDLIRYETLHQDLLHIQAGRR